MSHNKKVKYIYPHIFIMTTLVVLSSCTAMVSSSINSESSSNSSSRMSEDTTSLTNSQFIDHHAYQTFWSEETKIHIELDISALNLSLMNQFGQEKNNRYNDFYVPTNAIITINEDVIIMEQVAIRQKGNIFSRGAFLDNQTIVRPFHFRLRFDYAWDDEQYQPFGLKQNWTNRDADYQTRKERSLASMRSIELKWNRSNDPSMINQVYASRQFTQALSIAPHATLGQITFRAQPLRYELGVYTINEAIDEIFINRHFSGQASKGDLYKALYPVDLRYDRMVYRDGSTNQERFHHHMVGVEDTWNNYHPVYDLKTNKKNSTHASLMNLIRTLKYAGGFPFSEQLDLLKAVIDIPSFVQYAAISHLIGHPDDMRNNTNNTYIYFHGETQKAYFIPYDFDWSLGITWNEGLTLDTGSRHPLSPFGTYGLIENPIYWYTIFQGNHAPFSQIYPLQPTIQLAYRQKIKTLFEHSRFSIHRYELMFEKYKQHYQEVFSSLDTNTSFHHIEAFRYHYQLVAQTMLTY
jgi:spore coat protein CotH